MQQTTQQNHPMKKTLLMLALVAGITSFAQNAQAELITINIGSFGIDGPNGGLEYNDARSLVFPISGNGLTISYGYGDGIIGLKGYGGLTFAAGPSPATPVNFGPNALIGSGSTYVDNDRSVFQLDFVSPYAPRFGPESYMGFKTSQGNYGWLEVRWEPLAPSFQILSGAYESVAGASIVTPGAAPIPEPGTWAAMAIFAGGAAFAGWRRRKSAKVAA
jgi:hypothetical protein